MKRVQGLINVAARTRRAIRLERDVTFRNREGLADFDFLLPAGRTAGGVSAMVRARNESRKIESCLSSILPLFDEIIVVDNGSDDDTLRLVRAFKETHDGEDRMRVLEYPHAIARCGDEHWATPADSVHSLAYYYNWCLAQCSRSYVFKWDADMVVAKGKGAALRQLFAGLPGVPPEMWRVRAQTVYRAPDGAWYLAQDEVNSEVRLAPNRAAIRYRKARHWEVLRSDINVSTRDFEPVSIYELKDVSEDEFAHWSTRDFPTERKRREWENFERLRRGETGGGRFVHMPDDFVEVRSDASAQTYDIGGVSAAS